MKLETSDFVGYIKQRHYQSFKTFKAKLVLGIIVACDQAASASFIRAKQRYAQDIGATVIVETAATEAKVLEQIKQWNAQAEIKGIVVQLPLPQGFDTEAVIAQIDASKDIDGLRSNSPYDPATAKAIMWILAAQGLNIKELKICVVGQGRLVGAPISRMLESSGAQITKCDINTLDLAAKTLKADVVISGVGEAGLIKRSMLKEGALVIDAGTAEAKGKLTGDADPALYADPDIKVTPVPGGVGPVTVAALFDNLLLAAQNQARSA